MGLCAAGLCGPVLGAELGGGNTAPDVRMARRRGRGQTRVLPASAVGVALHPVWTAFGLAASALWPGTLMGALIPLTGPAAGALTLLCISFALYAILFSVKEAERTGPPRKGGKTI